MSITEYSNKKEVFYLGLLTIIKALSHENRLRILNLINQQELCVCEIETIMGVTQSNASRHLNKLNQANIIYGKKKAQWVYYHLNQDTLERYPFISLIINKELQKIKICQEDNKRLKEYLESEFTCKDLSSKNPFK
ncbi:regulatory protein ArsR [Halothermothrix orenii H 168]|uniref:Regulatory protein ArsR n=2 Tax=Halothermothrix orenii TaxID=31909 RepID=B8CY49_HALOH|nr:regulatory protein ArsR [Halothermothrix orenii H 168]